MHSVKSVFLAKFTSIHLEKNFHAWIQNRKFQYSVCRTTLMDRLENCLSDKTMCGYPTLSTKENRNVDKQLQNCFSCPEPMLLRLKKHTN